MTIAQHIQEKLNYGKLQPIDPATGLPKEQEDFKAPEQSAIVTFLAAIYKSSRAKENAQILANEKNAEQLLGAIFTDKFDAYKAIADYTNEPLETIKSRLVNVAEAFINIINEHSTDKDKRAEYLQDTLTAERHIILNHIPGGLKIGELLHDETMDDNTNKMQGPISSLMHKIENTFSTSD